MYRKIIKVFFAFCLDFPPLFNYFPIKSPILYILSTNESNNILGYIIHIVFVLLITSLMPYITVHFSDKKSGKKSLIITA